MDVIDLDLCRPALRPEIERRIAAVGRMAFIQLMSRSIKLTSQLRDKKITLSEARAIGRAIDRRMKVLEDELKSGRISL